MALLTALGIYHFLVINIDQKSHCSKKVSHLCVRVETSGREQYS